jgi:hypothetical protein
MFDDAYNGSNAKKERDAYQQKQAHAGSGPVTQWA